MMQHIGRNFVHFEIGVYVVKDQNGFAAAQYDCFGCYEDGQSLHSKAELRGMVQDYPKRYPAIVSFGDEVFECSRIHVSVLDLEYLGKIHEGTKKSIDAFQEWDRDNSIIST